MSTISAAMIVKDEAHHLYDCIASIRKEVDEIILCDTGSTDGTLNLEWLGDMAAPITLTTFRWCDDFSAARNDVLEACQGDWILIHDADQRYESGSIRGLVNGAAEDTLAFAVPVVNRMRDGSLNMAYETRLIRNRRGIRFRRRVHELPYMPDGSDVPTVTTDAIRSLHVGYDQDEATLKAKRERNRRLVDMGLADEPANPRYWFDAARVSLGDQDWRLALQRAELALHWWAMEGGPQREFVTACLEVALQCASKLGEPEVGHNCWNLVPAGYRTDRTTHLFAKMMIG